MGAQFEGSAALQFIQSRGWKFEEADEQRIRMNDCPFCGSHTHPAFVMEIHGRESETPGRDGLYMCHRCGKTGNLRALKEHLGVAMPQMESRREWAGQTQETEPLPDVNAIHEALLEDEDALDYLMNGRGFSMAVIQRQKIGLVPKRYFREAGEVKALVYPYLVNGNCVFVHYRTLPRMPISASTVVKAFNSPKGWDAPLYNQEVLREGISEIVMVEGEANCIAAIDKGFLNIVGVPGANFKKADWIDVLDKLELERIYVCYDKDRPGQRAAQALASRIGVEKCWKIKLPDFEVTVEGETRQGKDLNEWFAFGNGTAEGFEQLKRDAEQFDVDGVASGRDALAEFEEQILGNGVEPRYKLNCWPSLAELVGFDPGDVIDILAPEKIGKTTFGLNLLEYVVDTYGEDGVIICLEMTRAKMARKWVSHVAQIADNLPKTPQDAEKLKAAFINGIKVARQRAAGRSGDLYFCYPKYESAEDIYTLMRDCIRRYGVKWIMLDNIQRLCDSTIKSRMNRTQYLSEISKKTSQIAKDFNIQVVRILQPHRIAAGKIVNTDDTDGASQIAKDCDATIVLHRNRIGEISANDFESMPFFKSDASFDEKMLVNVGLSRYSGGGQTTLHCDGAKSTVREYNLSQIAVIKAEAQKEVGYEGQLKALYQKDEKPGEVAPTGTGEITL